VKLERATQAGRGVTFMFRKISNFVRNDAGATAIEYALLGSLIALVLVGVLTALGTGLSSEFSEVSGMYK
jgi:pilus assembly protein Flp/PilA